MKLERKHILLSALIFSAALLFAACAVPPPMDIPLKSPEPVSTSGITEEDTLKQKNLESGIWMQDYRISVGDVLSIQYPYHSEYTADVMVLPDGAISVVLLGRILAAGKTPQMLADELSDKYAELAESSEPTTSKQIRQKRYRIQPGDALEIKFSSHPELDEAVLVRPDGRISLRLVKTIIAEGMTPEGLRSVLENLYSDHLSDPDLAVIVRETRNNDYFVNGKKKRPIIPNLDVVNLVVRRYSQLQVYVGGEVAAPGFYDYGRPITAMQAIIVAGGNTDRAELRTVAIIRKGLDGKGTIFIRNLKSDRVISNKTSDNPIETAANNDMVLQPYDVVIVPISQIASAGRILDQYLYSLIPNLRNIANFGFVYDLNPVDVNQ